MSADAAVVGVAGTQLQIMPISQPAYSLRGFHVSTNTTHVGLYDAVGFVVAAGMPAVGRCTSRCPASLLCVARRINFLTQSVPTECPNSHKGS
jgi:hypothetical protein